MRPYRTLRALRAGDPVEIDGVMFVREPGDIAAGDTYVAERNTGPKLLTAARFAYYDGYRHDTRISSDFRDVSGAVCSWVIPVETAYCYDSDECVKVRLAED